MKKNRAAVNASTLCGTVFAIAVLSGCTTTGGGFRVLVSDMDNDNFSAKVGNARPNQGGREFGLKTVEDGFENEILSICPDWTSFGILVDIKNKTEFLLGLNWDRCVLVDHKGTSHSVVHPDRAFDGPESAAPTTIWIAPESSRRFQFIPSVSVFQTPRIFGQKAFHPSNQEAIKLGSFVERFTISLQFQRQEISYDFKIRYTLKNSPEIPGTTSAPTRQTADDSKATSFGDSTVLPLRP